jgi:hypothetical protein
MVIWVAVVVGIYGYVILLSLLAVRMHVGAVHGPHRHGEHGGMGRMWHLVEHDTHSGVASGMAVSLMVRLLQLTTDLTSWVLVPLTLGAALMTLPLASIVLRMAREDYRNMFLSPAQRLKTAVLVGSSAGVLVDQAVRVVMLF